MPMLSTLVLVMLAVTALMFFLMIVISVGR